MRRTFKYRLLGNNTVFSKADNWLYHCRNLYNTALEQRILIYQQNKSRVSCYEQIKQLPDFKIAFPEYKDIGSQVLQGVLERLEASYKSFFRRIKAGNVKAGFPRFKSKDRYNSFTFKKQGWKLEGKFITIKKIGKFKLRLSRRIEGDIKTVTIKRDKTNKWYVSFNCDNVPEHKLHKSSKSVGIDVGIKSFCVDSKGNKTDNPLYLKQAEIILRRRQRKLSRRVKGSNSRRKARLQVAKAYEKIANQRNDFLHKLANQYIKNYGTIYVEDLKIKNMAKNRHLAKAINDSSWGKFFEMLHYKAEEAGRKVLKVPPHNTSQICSNCGEKVAKTLAERTHSCPYCKLIMDRDENAARNINRLGQSLQPLTYEVTQCVG